jgi:hypothetical protein
MQHELVNYFRCPEKFVELGVADHLSSQPGYFRFGEDLVCYGRTASGTRAKNSGGNLYDVAADVRFHGLSADLPFDADEVATNLRYERYARVSAGSGSRALGAIKRSTYYMVRPLLPVALRKHLQKAHLSGWRDIAFPRWPVDTTVDTLMEKLLAMAIKCRGGKSVPFIWFWPDGMTSCAIMTHDVEEAAGVDYCARLMDINESFNIPASFQVVPEKRYRVTAPFLESIRARGFEVNIHDLNHDGKLFENHAQFKRRSARINQYGRDLGAVGFRAAVLYRNQEWFDLLDFQYDTSVPNVAHLDPQRGGCCTVMPYFIGKMVELPVTATQDYPLFHILNDYSLSLWESQIDIILQKHGLLNTIVHPDYLTSAKEEETYIGLLGIYDRLRRQRNVWVPLPRDASNWWRQRSQMRLVHQNGEWRIEGPGKERAVVAFASLEDDVLTYNVMHPSGQVIKRPVSYGAPVEVV